MKTIFLKVTTLIIILASFLVMNTSCENNSPSANSIVGTWFREPHLEQSFTLYKNGSAYFDNMWGTGSGSYTYNKQTAVLVMNTPDRGVKTFIAVTIQNGHMTFLDNEAYAFSFVRK